MLIPEFFQNSQHCCYSAVQMIIFVVYNYLIFERLDLEMIFEIQFQFRIFFVSREFVSNQKRTTTEIPDELAF